MISITMYMTPPADIGFGYFLSTTFIFGLLVVFLAIVFIEALILWVVKWDSFRSCLIASALMNVLSSIIGVFLFIVITFLDLDIGFIPYWISSWLLSALLEGTYLFYSGHTSSRAWIAAAIANIGSYILIVAIAWYITF